ncbi:DUF5829 family protein [Bryobacter aggregatus]|uniref:DUF5829 family protein n=1 Tax=Bryobacter aggregatus TaxID=360054 RepID=UPI0004E1E0FD|nr:DUF5829 family protein [Bryobacter aggregatus]
MTRRALASLLVPPLVAAPTVPKLNHFYATLDAASYRAIENSQFLQEHFAPFERRTTVRNDGSYTGLYFYGAETYFEFFEEYKGNRKPGDAGLALGIEAEGGSQALRAQWQSLGPSLVSTVTRQMEGQAIDWFDMVSFEGDTRERSVVPGLRLFSMEYKASFLKRWHPEAAGSIRQSEILAAYCAKLGLAETRKNGMLKDVAMVEVANPVDGITLRAQQLVAAGWAAKGGSCHGPNAVIRFHAAARSRGITRVEFTLQGNPRAATHRFGKTVLVIQPKRAIWTFRP